LLAAEHESTLMKKPAGDGSSSAMCCCGLMHFNENNTFSLS
jgi:hypothetical protein